MTRGTFTTTLVWDQDGEEQEADVRVLYSYTKGYPATWEEPGAGAEIEIISITPADPTIRIPEHFFDSEELKDECSEDQQAEAEAALEWRAQCRRDDALMDAVNRSRGAA